MSLEDETNIDHLAKLCRIKCADEDKAEFKSNLLKILDYMRLLEEVETINVDPCTHVLETVLNVMREDKVSKGMNRSDFLNNAPEQVGGMIKVPPVIQFEE